MYTVQSQVEHWTLSFPPAKHKPTVAELFEYVGRERERLRTRMLEALVCDAYWSPGRNSLVERCDMMEPRQVVVLLEIDYWLLFVPDR